MLDDLLRPGLTVVFCGTAVATASAARGHYYSGRGNKFWHLLHEAGFTPRLLAPEEDHAALGFGIGFTDLVKDVAQSHDRGLDYSKAVAVADHIAAADPRWVAFNGLEAGRAAANRLHRLSKRTIVLGEQEWRVGNSRVFVLPSSSGAGAAMPYAEKLRWWSLLCERSRAAAG